MPNGRNPHGIGSVVLGMKMSSRNLHTEGRKPDRSLKQGALNKNEAPVSLREMLKYDENGKCVNAMKIMSNPIALKTAYHRIKSNPGNMTRGPGKETLDGISDSWFDKTAQELGSLRYKCKPTRRVYIRKANGKMRPLGIAPPRDKIVQEIMRAIIEHVVEVKFLPCSHGFRPEKGCQTALKQIRA